MPALRQFLRRRWWLLLLMLPLLLIAALFAVILTVDPSRYRPAIESQAQKQFGLALRLQGELHWRLWPLLAIESGAGTLQAPLLSWEHLVFNADLPALLRSQWQLDSLQIDGLRLDLRRDANGHGNWELPDSGGPPAALQIQLKRFALANAFVSYEAADSGTKWAVGPADLSLGARVDRGAQATQLSVTDVRLKLAGALVRGSVQGTVATDAARSALQGRIEFETAALRAFLQQVGVTPPATSDAAVLGAARFSTEWVLSGQHVAFKLVKLKLDDTSLSGGAQVDLRGDTPRLRVDLVGDSLVLDRYLSPASGAPFTLPVAELKSLPVTGVIQLDSAQANGVTMKGAKLQLVGAQ